MAESINFSKKKAAYFIDCLARGMPIEGPWNFDSLMMLAGACLFAARSHGPFPVRIQREGAGALALERLPPDFLLSTEGQFMAESNAAVEFYAHLAMLVKDDEYDGQFEPSVRAFVYIEDGENKVHPVSGFSGESS